MSTAKIEVKIGSFTFSGEGEEGWLAKQLDKVLERSEKLNNFVLPENNNSGANNNLPKGDIIKTTLPSYLSSKGATKNQVKKFGNESLSG